ncbi:MAG: hypothetical protein ACLT38_00420 [Akkermansia sp.]
MTKTALSALALAFAGALPGVAQQTASPAPFRLLIKASAVEKAFMNQMAGVVQASLKAGALDVKAVSGVLNEAVKADVSDRVMGAMVSMAAGAFPSSAPAVASAAVRSYGSNIREGHVRNVIASAVSSQSNPYASVAPISEAVEKVLGNSPVAAAVSSIAVDVAAQTPDNPLRGNCSRFWSGKS